MEFEFVYGVSRRLLFPVIIAGENNFAASADWTPASGDVRISQDGGNVANTSNLPTAVGGTGSVLWSLVLTAAELQAEVVAIQIVDSATKAIEDQALTGYLQHFGMSDYYTVNTGSFTATATQFEGDRFSRSEEATSSHFNGRNILFVTGALQGKMTDISAYALQNTRGFFTVTSLGEIPANGDIFVIL